MNDKVDSGKNDREPFFRFLVPIIATLIASLGATLVTYVYNQKQIELAQIEALDKYHSYLNSKDPVTREYGYFVFEELGHSDFVNRLALGREDPAALKALLSRSDSNEDLFGDNITASIADKIMSKAASAQQKIVPPPLATYDTGKQKKGWVYLGHFISDTKTWKTRYLDFPTGLKPSDLKNETYQVREETGALNVRVGMPTIFGQFRDVQDVLKEGSDVLVLEYSEWQSSGYMWAKVGYSTK